jgi:hypothetical protein
MSFTGDLEHLPIVDVIQLLSSTGKTGTLSVKSQRGECRLVFVNGYITGANHHDNSKRIGRVLVDMNLLSRDDLEKAYDDQSNAEQDRKALIAILIEQGTINKDVACKALETSIEISIVEVLTWTSGTFALELTAVEDISHEFRYVTENLQQEFALNAQSLLMDALRIYDEKMHDGTLNDLFYSTGDSTLENGVPEEGPVSQTITADLLGLDSLDSLVKKIPETFRVLKDHKPSDEHRHLIKKQLPELSHEEQEQLCAYLSEHIRPVLPDVPDSAVILLSHDEFLAHAVTTVCNLEGFFVFTTDDDANLDIIIERSLMRNLNPVLIIDVQHASDEENIIALAQQKRTRYPRISILLTVCAHRNYEFTLLSLKSGALAVFPRPCGQEQQEKFVPGTISLLKSLGVYLKTFFITTERRMESDLITSFEQLATAREPSEAASILLRFTATKFERSLTFVVGRSELIAERGIGIKSDKSSGPSRPLMFKIPLEEPSIFRDVIENEKLYYDQCIDPVLSNHLFKEIGVPHSTKILLVPLKCNGKVIALTYADFGTKAVSPQQTVLIDILAKHAGVILDSSLQRKKV